MAKKQNEAKDNQQPVKPLAALVALDGAVAEAIAPHSDKGWARALGFIGKQGDQPQMLTLSGLVLAGGVFRGNRRVIEAGARMIAAHLLATATKHVIKRRVDRHRPPKEEGGKVDARPRFGRRDDKAWTSFPSGHTAGAVAVAQAFARVFPEHRARATAAAATISGAQVCKQAHYLTDVTAGIVIGAASEALVHRFWPQGYTALQA